MAPEAALLRLEVSQVVKRFGGVTALGGVDFEVRAAEVHCLCGENGAGKSTLIKILAGVHPYGTYGGTIRVDGHIARFGGPRDAMRAGIAVIHQELALVEALSVAENLFLGELPRRGPWVDWSQAAHEAGVLLGRFGIDVDPWSPVENLGVGRKQQLAILKALRTNPRVLILDEPTAALGEAEARRLLELVRGLAAQGVACVYITHRLDEVRAVADRVTILRDGRSVASFDTGQVSAAALIRAMAGRPVTESAPRREPPSGGFGQVLLQVSELEVSKRRDGSSRLMEMSFEVRAGEVLGLAGVVGSGRSELLMHLYGNWGFRRRGIVRVAGEPHDEPSPERSLAKGLALLTEDRQRLGLFPERPVGFNLTISSLARITRHGWLELQEEARMYRRMADALSVRAAGPEVPIGTLSGGSQQKVLLGRVLLTRPRVLLLDEPTRGVDVATKFEIYERINQLSQEGMAIVLVGSELPELLGLSDRLLILRGGRIAAELSRERFDQERILAIALGHSVPMGRFSRRQDESSSTHESPPAS